MSSAERDLAFDSRSILPLLVAWPNSLGCFGARQKDLDGDSRNTGVTHCLFDPGQNFSNRVEVGTGGQCRHGRSRPQRGVDVVVNDILGQVADFGCSGCRLHIYPGTARGGDYEFVVGVEAIAWAGSEGGCGPARLLIPSGGARADQALLVGHAGGLRRQCPAKRGAGAGQQDRCR